MVHTQCKSKQYLTTLQYATVTTQAPWLKKHDQTKARLDSQRPQAATNGHSIVLIGLQRDPCVRSIIPLTFFIPYITQPANQARESPSLHLFCKPCMMQAVQRVVD